MDALARMLLAGGLSAEEYDAVRYEVTESNRKNLLLYSSIGCVFFCVLSIASLLTTQGPPSTNYMTYIVSCVVTGIIATSTYLLSRRDSSAQASVVWVLMYAFMLVLHVFSISLSIRHVDYPAVSAIVFLMVNPMLFTDRPVRAMAVTAVAVAAICVTSACWKDPALATDDVWNAVTFGMVALAVDVLTMRVKLTQCYQAREIAYLSETDSLTQLRNRNNYEMRLEDYPRSGAKVLVVAYADANGLRETNNTKGHDAGDELLRAIASQMRKRFGERDTYRIGGDEFVAILADTTADEVRKKMRRMQEQLEEEGHSVSCGAAECEAAHADMRSLVRAAEKEMYEQKRAYHANDAVEVDR